MNAEQCCPEFDPVPWDDKIHEWEDKRFIKARVFTLFYMPVNFGSVVVRMLGKIQSAGAQASDWMGLSDHTSPWNMDLYLAVDREIPGVENTTLTGQFYSKVYEGPYKDTSKWCKDYAALVEEKKLGVKKWFMWYTTCPKCAKKYGKNYVVVLGKVE